MPTSLPNRLSAKTIHDGRVGITTSRRRRRSGVPVDRSQRWPILTGMTTARSALTRIRRCTRPMNSPRAPPAIDPRSGGLPACFSEWGRESTGSRGRIGEQLIQVAERPRIHRCTAFDFPIRVIGRMRGRGGLGRWAHRQRVGGLTRLLLGGRVGARLSSGFIRASDGFAHRLVSTSL
jgi:hypothetical protein